MDFKEIGDARKILGLDEYATIEEIEDAYRKRALEFHPDKCNDSEKKVCEERFKKIAHARDILMSYCAGYKYSFKEKDVKRCTMNAELYKHLKQFYDGWWGDLDF